MSKHTLVNTLAIIALLIALTMALTSFADGDPTPQPNITLTHLQLAKGDTLVLKHGVTGEVYKFVVVQEHHNTSVLSGDAGKLKGEYEVLDITFGNVIGGVMTPPPFPDRCPPGPCVPVLTVDWR